MFAAFAINISSALVTVWLSLAPEEISFGRNLIDGYSHCLCYPRWVRAGSEELITLFLETVIRGEDGEISFKMFITGPQFKLMGLR